MDLAIIIGILGLIFVFLYLTYLIESRLVKGFALAISLGFVWLLLAVLLQLSIDAPSSDNIIQMLRGAYSYGSYTILTIYGFMLIYALYNLFNWVATSYKK